MCTIGYNDICISFKKLEICDYFAIEKSIVDVGGYSQITTSLANILTSTDTDVSSSILGVTYYYRVAAVNAYGTSSYSATSSITFTEAIPPVPLNCFGPPFQAYAITGSTVVALDL